ncbi:alpha/beta hydrolase [Hymenobacter ginsengisoli]|uniref:Alpha/beta hydrolase n=1 Tax=Hymenobacter ginsengisoli TaxID=1051626 RepID=A0ABP8Q2H3_9BACT|nr:MULTISPECIES: alpha/beta hydrolase [unclassified Hymenobacter]MBO2032449.1 alpha/beta hydrolase [Hymenobacter sp. BT559]
MSFALPFRRCALALSFVAAFASRPASAQTIPATPSQAPAAHPSFVVQVVGKGRPVLLIPGLNCTGAVWDETVARYRGQYQCHVITLAGFGSVAPQQPVSAHLLQDVRDQILAYVKAQKLNRPVVIGHSLGGFLTLWMAATDPTALGPLEIVDSLPFLPVAQNPTATVENTRPQAELMRQQMRQGQLPFAARRQMTAGMVSDTARITQVARWGQASDPATTGQAMYDMYTTDLRPAVARIQQPVLVLGTWAGYAAYGATKAGVQQVFDLQYAPVPHHTLVMSEAGKHFVMYDDAQLFFSQTDAFLKQPTVAVK